MLNPVRFGSQPVISKKPSKNDPVSFSSGLTTINNYANGKFQVELSLSDKTIKDLRNLFCSI